MKIDIVSVKIDGIYQWGSGWSTTASDIWDSFFRYDMKKYCKVFWNAVENDMGGWYLVTTTGGGMIHPMEATFTLHWIGSNSNRYAIEALRDIFDEIVVNRLHGTYKIRVRTIDEDDIKKDEKVVAIGECLEFRNGDISFSYDFEAKKVIVYLTKCGEMWHEDYTCTTKHSFESVLQNYMDEARIDEEEATYLKTLFVSNILTKIRK